MHALRYFILFIVLFANGHAQIPQDVEYIQTSRGYPQENLIINNVYYAMRKRKETPKKKEGDSCLWVDSCNSVDLVCLNGKCVQRIGEGEDCVKDACVEDISLLKSGFELKEPTHCSRRVGETKGICRFLGSRGWNSTCISHRDCDDRLWCMENKCVLGGKVHCRRHSDCDFMEDGSSYCFRDDPLDPWDPPPVTSDSFSCGQNEKCEKSMFRYVACLMKEDPLDCSDEHDDCCREQSEEMKVCYNNRIKRETDALTTVEFQDVFLVIVSILSVFLCVGCLLGCLGINGIILFKKNQKNVSKESLQSFIDVEDYENSFYAELDRLHD